MFNLRWIRFGVLKLIPPERRVHQLLVKRGIPIGDICEATTWAHDSVFTSFYRLDTVSRGTSLLGRYWFQNGSYMSILLGIFGVYIGT